MRVTSLAGIFFPAFREGNKPDINGMCLSLMEMKVEMKA